MSAANTPVAPASPTFAEVEAVRICRELIRIDSSNYGDGTGPGERAAAEYVMTELTNAGYDPVLVESAPGRANVLLRIAGHDRTRPGLVLHGHTDVVPAAATDWKMDPFGGEEMDGLIWGRGAVDMKDMDAMILACVRELARTGTDLVAYGAEDTVLDRLLAIDEELRAQESRAAWLRGIATAGQVVAAGIAVAAALWFGTTAVASGALDPRFLAVLALTPLAMHEVLATFTQAAQTLTRAGTALGRITEILDAEPVGTGDVTVGEGKPGLELLDVSAGWPIPSGPFLSTRAAAPSSPVPGSRSVQSSVTLAVAPGERVALVGPSGVGKTTVAATAMGLIPPLSGTVRRGGRVGYLAQDAHIFATTVAENVRIGNRDATAEDIADALARAGLPIDPERRIGEAGSTLSGGERRRLALARLLVGRRDLIILDEPTEHLDRETADALMADVWRAFADAPVLVITHDADVIAACDRVHELA